MGCENHPWYNWIAHGPELGFEAKLDYISGRRGAETGLQIKALGDTVCSGFYGFDELKDYGFSPDRIASIADLQMILRRRPSSSASI